MAHLLTLVPATRQRPATDTLTLEVTPAAGQRLGFCATVTGDGC